MDIIDENNVAYTKEETIDLLLRNLHDIKEGYEKSKNSSEVPKKANGMYLTYASLSIIERESVIGPGFHLKPTSNSDNIAGELGTLIAFPDKILEKIKEEGRINKIQFAFIQRMKALTERFGKGEIKDGDELIASILRTIDYGVEGVCGGFKLISFSKRKLCYSDAGNNIPTQHLKLYHPYNIAGNLSTRYRELYMPKTIEKDESRTLED